jgi:hypothetical protein
MAQIVRDVAALVTANASTQEILRTLVSHNPSVDVNHDDFLSESKMCGDKINGNVCINILDKCLSAPDAQSCVAAWGNLPWAAGLNWEEMDHGAASSLAQKLGLDTKSVDEVVKELTTAFGSAPSETVKMALQGIKNRISPSPMNVRPVASTSKVSGVPERVVVVPMALTGFGMRGGGSNTMYANYVRRIDALKVNLSMNGGGQHTAAMVRASLAELKQLLAKGGKSIDENDLVRINDAIDSLERSEKRVVKAQEYMNILTQAIKESKIDVKSMVAKPTLKILEDLAVKEKDSRSAVTKKALSLTDLLASLQSALTKIEAKLP